MLGSDDELEQAISLDTLMFTVRFFELWSLPQVSLVRLVGYVS